MEKYLEEIHSVDSVSLPRHVPLMHSLMLVVACIPPTEETFQFLVSHFLSFPVMSVQLACENYFLKITGSSSDADTKAKEYAPQMIYSYFC